MAPFWNFAAILIMVLTATVNAHMRLYYPPPFNAPNNPYRTGPNDTRLEYPYGCCDAGETPICRGYLSQLGTEQGRPVATWETGTIQHFSLTGNGTHYGGSCQAGFSVDKGETWKVVASYEGNCPHRHFGSRDIEGQTFEFTVPADMPLGNHVFAWTWINREKEFFMLCSSVEITGPGDQQGVGDTINTEPPRDSISQLIPPTASPTNDDVHDPPTSPAPSFVPQQTDALNNEPTGATQFPAPSSPPIIIAIPPDILASKANERYEGPYVFNAMVPKPHIGFGSHRRSGKHLRARSNTFPDYGFGRLYVPAEAPRPTTTSNLKKKRTDPAPEVAFFDRPNFLFANIKNGCETVNGTAEVKYPSPGPDVVTGDGTYPLAFPTVTEGCTMRPNITSSEVGMPEDAAMTTGGNQF